MGEDSPSEGDVKLRRGSAAATKRPGLVHQCLIVPIGTDPCVWRNILIPASWAFLQAIAASHAEHESTLGWVGAADDPDAFDPAAVVFDNPKKRWKRAFGG